MTVTGFVAEPDSSREQVTVPPLSANEEELQDRETVGVVDLPSVNVIDSLCVPLSAALVTDVTLMTIFSLPSVLASDFPVNTQRADLSPLGIVREA